VAKIYLRGKEPLWVGNRSIIRLKETFDKNLLLGEKRIRKEEGTVKEKNRVKGKGEGGVS